MSTHHAALAELVQRNPRYAYEAYEFILKGVEHTQELLGRSPGTLEPNTEPSPEHHVSGKELVDGICDLAITQFGLMARIVFRMWGINKTDDIGELVFNLVEARLMYKTDHDTLEDFRNLYDLDKSLRPEFRVQLDEAEWIR